MAMKEDVGIYTKEDTLIHKLRMVSDPDIEIYWVLNYRDKKGQSLEEAIEVNDVVEPKRMWVAMNGMWAGYFEVKRVECNELILDSWKAYHKRMIRTPFQGYTFNVPTEG